MQGALLLFEHAAGLQNLCGRSILEDVVSELDEPLFYRLDSLPSCAAILHEKELGAQIVKPQHVGVGVVVSPVVSEITQLGTWSIKKIPWIFIFIYIFDRCS